MVMRQNDRAFNLGQYSNPGHRTPWASLLLATAGDTMLESLKVAKRLLMSIVSRIPNRYQKEKPESIDHLLGC